MDSHQVRTLLHERCERFGIANDGHVWEVCSQSASVAAPIAGGVQYGIHVVQYVFGPNRLLEVPAPFWEELEPCLGLDSRDNVRTKVWLTATSVKRQPQLILSIGLNAGVIQVKRKEIVLAFVA